MHVCLHVVSSLFWFVFRCVFSSFLHSVCRSFVSVVRVALCLTFLYLFCYLLISVFLSDVISFVYFFSSVGRYLFQIFRFSVFRYFVESIIISCFLVFCIDFVLCFCVSFCRSLFRCFVLLFLYVFGMCSCVGIQLCLYSFV